jgi:hypothetical protein
VQLTDSEMSPPPFLTTAHLRNDEAEVRGSVSDANTAVGQQERSSDRPRGHLHLRGADGTELRPLRVNTNSIGNFRSVTLLHQAGEVKITATSGSASKEVTLTTEDPVEGYAVELNNLTVGPGETGVLTGKVTDMFGNGVPSFPVHLSVSNAGLGNLQVIDPITNDGGVFSTSFVADANSNGTATVTATLAKNNGDEDLWDEPVTVPLGTSELQSQNARAEADEWVELAELPPFSDGQYKDTSDLTIVPNTITISVPETRVGPGVVTVSGVARKGSSVEIYRKATGPASPWAGSRR